MSPANPQGTTSAGADSPPISEQLYVLQTNDGAAIDLVAQGLYSDKRILLPLIRKLFPRDTLEFKAISYKCD